jgi:hypothetical protein
MENLEIILKEYEALKGQFIIDCVDKVVRLIGIVEDDFDYYYVLYDGERFIHHSCLMDPIPLKGKIDNKHYERLVKMAEINHMDQPGIFSSTPSDVILNFNNDHKKKLTDECNKNHKFIAGPYWEIE